MGRGLMEARNSELLKRLGMVAAQGLVIHVQSEVKKL